MTSLLARDPAGHPATRRVQLLISVKNAEEAHVAAVCGADIVDAKDPARGALGCVAPGELHAISAVVADRCPLSAAIGELDDGTVSAAGEAAAAGIAFAKVACDRSPVDRRRLAAVIAALERHAPPGRRCQLILARYADASQAGAEDIIDLAAAVGATGVLLDTRDKRGQSLFALTSPDDVAAWVRRAHSAGLTVALAGSLGPDDIGTACETGADIIGVRGAVCDGGRNGQLSAERVRRMVNRGPGTGSRDSGTGRRGPVVGDR